MFYKLLHLIMWCCGAGWFVFRLLYIDRYLLDDVVYTAAWLRVLDWSYRVTDRITPFLLIIYRPETNYLNIQNSSL